MVKKSDYNSFTEGKEGTFYIVGSGIMIIEVIRGNFGITQ